MIYEITKKVADKLKGTTLSASCCLDDLLLLERGMGRERRNGEGGWKGANRWTWICNNQKLLWWWMDVCIRSEGAMVVLKHFHEVFSAYMKNQGYKLGTFQQLWRSVILNTNHAMKSVDVSASFASAMFASLPLAWLGYLTGKSSAASYFQVWHFGACLIRLLLEKVSASSVSLMFASMGMDLLVGINKLCGCIRLWLDLVLGVLI